MRAVPPNRSLGSLVLVLVLVTIVAYAQQAPTRSQQAPPPTQQTPRPAQQAAPASPQGAAASAYGIAVKRPVLQGACKPCPWGAAADVIKKMMAPYGYDVAVCYSCSGADAVRTVAKRIVGPEITDRQFGEGTTFLPEGPVDFGVTGLDGVRRAYEGQVAEVPEGRRLRIIARIESPSYLMMAVTKSSGISDLRQIRERKMPVRIMGNNQTVLEYYGLTQKEVEAWGGKFLAGNALSKNPNFDVIMGGGVLANNPEGNMWYEMTMKTDLVFLPFPEDLLQKLLQQTRGAQIVELPFRYMRGVPDTPIRTIGTSGTVVYGRDDLPDQFVYDVAKAIDEHHGLLKWAIMPFSYDPATVAEDDGVPLHPGAARYYRERGYLK